MEQLILHLVGDYLTQSHWMAQNKRLRDQPAFWHSLVYALPFYAIGSPAAVLGIWFTHYLIDRYGLARYVIFAKNFLAPPSEWPKWEDCKATGYPSATPAWLAVWLMIAGDNTLHLAINYACLRWLR